MRPVNVIFYNHVYAGRTVLLCNKQLLTNLKSIK